jgi:hypothetical protein
MRLTLAELIYLSRFDCVTTREPITGQPALNDLFGGKTSLVACRLELDGKGFADLLRLAKHGKVKVGFITEPP